MVFAGRRKCRTPLSAFPMRQELTYRSIRARKDKRFLEAFKMLESKTVDGQIFVERVVPKLAGLSFCKKGEASALATMRYQEILRNLEG